MKNDFFIWTNYQAPNNRVVKTRVGSTDAESWQNIIPERRNVVVESEIIITNNKVISKQRVNGASTVNVLDLRTSLSYTIPLEEKVYSVHISQPDDAMESDSIRLSLSSYALPSTDYSYNLRTRKKTFIQKTMVNNFSPADYETKMIQVPVRDGELVPVSMVYHKRKYQKDGNHPLLIESYSWYGYAFDPFFNSDLISLLDRGFAYAYVHARGGSEKDHRGGMLAEE